MSNETKAIKRRTFNEIADVVLGEVMDEIMANWRALEARETLYRQLGKPDEIEWIRQRREGMLDAAGLVAVAKDRAAGRVF